MKPLRISLLIFLLISTLLAQDYGRRVSPKTEEKLEPPLQSLEKTVQHLALEGSIDPQKYVLSAGDELGLNINTGEALTFTLTVTPTGDLFIPSVGVCNVDKLTLSEAVQKVNNFVRDNVYPDAQTHLALLRPRHLKVLVSGAVIDPGFVTITPLTRLDEIIDICNGFHQLAKEYEILIERQDGTTESIDYYQYLLSGNLDANPTFLEGDRIKIPFGDLNESGIVVRGSIVGAGYDIIREGEKLGDFIRRQVTFEKNADLQNVTLSRTVSGEIVQMTILPKDFDKTEIHAQDEINFMWERGVMVTGFVQEPGGFSYFPGYSVSEYIALAGGNSSDGNPRAVSIRHTDGSVEQGLETKVVRGDVVYVPRTRKDIYIGNSSVLGVVTAFITIYLAYLSATK